ncbi:UNVERIFIED_CONTAM: carotenoid cleavage dioxygenase [Williamsia faeni]
MALQTSHTGSDHPFLTGNYAPVNRELTEYDLPVTGTIPCHLDGRYVRIGPNPMGAVDPDQYELFLGDGMVHGLRISDGRAHWYRNRWVRSADVSRRLGEQRDTSRRSGGVDFAANTYVLRHAGRTLALAEGGTTPYELTDELDTVGPFDFCGTLRGGYTGHPKTDPVTGEMHAIAYSPVSGPSVRYSVTGLDGRIRRVVDIDVPNTMMHDFALTENNVVIFDLPVVLDLSVLHPSRPFRIAGPLVNRFARTHAMPAPLAGLLEFGSKRVRPHVAWPYRWDPKYQARFGAMPRGGGAHDLRWFPIDPCFIYHTLNAYEVGNTIVLEAPAHPTTYDGNSMPFNAPPTLERWIIDLEAGSVRTERLDDRGQEFPRFDERIAGRKHRFGYTVGFETNMVDNGYQLQVLFKHDFVRQTTLTADFGPRTVPGEFVFVASAPDSGEDDGVVMGFVYDGMTDRSDLVILDAATLEQIARVHLPTRIPSGFHGNWIPTETKVDA